MAENKYITSTMLPGVFVISRPTYPDNRGFFREYARLDELNSHLGMEFIPRQFNHSLSQPGVIRGLHAENWNKLVYPSTGTVFIALVDLRRQSPTFAQHITFTINTAESLSAIFISKGVANSTCVVGTQPVNYLYCADAYYDGSDTTAVAWDDPDLHISWPVSDPIISDRDRHNPRLRTLFPDWKP